MPTILISAGDASGEAIGAELVRALSRRVPEARFVGLGGKGMAEAGVECVADQSALAISGFGELVPSLRGIYCAWRSMRSRLVRRSRFRPIVWPTVTNCPPACACTLALELATNARRKPCGPTSMPSCRRRSNESRRHCASGRHRFAD